MMMPPPTPAQQYVPMPASAPGQKREKERERGRERRGREREEERHKENGRKRRRESKGETSKIHRHKLERTREIRYLFGLLLTFLFPLSLGVAPGAYIMVPTAQQQFVPVAQPYMVQPMNHMQYMQQPVRARETERKSV